MALVSIDVIREFWRSNEEQNWSGLSMNSNQVYEELAKCHQNIAMWMQSNVSKHLA